ncbi:MAG: VOC family protein [Phenylobacterium sp.]
MVDKVTPFLMFQGDAVAAIARYRELFAGAEVRHLEHYGPKEPGPEGQVRRATLVLAGQELMIFDSPVKHAFGFTPSISIFVDCADELEIEQLFAGAVGRRRGPDAAGQLRLLAALRLGGRPLRGVVAAQPAGRLNRAFAKGRRTGYLPRP